MNCRSTQSTYVQRGARRRTLRPKCLRVPAPFRRAATWRAVLQSVATRRSPLQRAALQFVATGCVATRGSPLQPVATRRNLGTCERSARPGGHRSSSRARAALESLCTRPKVAHVMAPSPGADVGAVRHGSCDRMDGSSPTLCRRTVPCSSACCAAADQWAGGKGILWVPAQMWQQDRMIAAQGPARAAPHDHRTDSNAAADDRRWADRTVRAGGMQARQVPRGAVRPCFAPSGRGRSGKASRDALETGGERSFGGQTLPYLSFGRSVRPAGQCTRRARGPEGRSPFKLRAMDQTMSGERWCGMPWAFECGSYALTLVIDLSREASTGQPTTSEPRPSMCGLSARV